MIHLFEIKEMYYCAYSVFFHQLPPPKSSPLTEPHSSRICIHSLFYLYSGQIPDSHRSDPV